MRDQPRFGLGLMLCLFGSLPLIYCFGFSTLVSAEFEEGTSEWWWATVKAMFRPGDALLLTLGGGIVVAMGLFWLGHGVWFLVLAGTEETRIRSRDDDFDF